MRSTSDLIVIGAGIVGAAAAFFAARAGLSVTVIERGLPASGTSSRCEGNILLSDKELGPELDLAIYSLDVWERELAEHADAWEYQPKGGLIVASRESSMASLQRVVAAQRQHGIQAQELDAAGLNALEPWARPDAVGAAYYPQDAQVQPVLATVGMLRQAEALGATVLTDTLVTALLRDGERVTGVRTPRGDFSAGAVLNATGTWGGQVAALAGVDVPVLPRRGFVMITEPLPPRVHHKVYAAEYIDNVGSSDAGLQASPVVESTPAGTILIGSSRERVGFSSEVSMQALRTIAANAVELFPFLADVRILRHYHGFRPYCPDHLPVIGADERAPGLWHACGHEGAGIGLSVGTGKLLAQALTGAATDLDLAPFAPSRFGGGAPGVTIAADAAADATHGGTNSTASTNSAEEANA